MNRRRPSQRGVAMLAVLVVVLVILAGGMLVNAMQDTPQLAAQTNATPTLSEARDALLGRARAEWCIARTGTVADFLPCPNVAAPEGQAPAACAPASLGRLPWRTLGLAPLRDAAGECLWYRRTLVGAQVIAPGAALPGQTRASVAGAPICGGNYASAQYVEAVGNDIVLTIDAADLAIPTACP